MNLDKCPSEGMDIKSGSPDGSVNSAWEGFQCLEAQGGGGGALPAEAQTRGEAAQDWVASFGTVACTECRM